MNERTNERGGEGGRGVKGSENSPLKCQGLFTTAAAAVEEEEEGGREEREDRRQRVHECLNSFQELVAR